VAIACADYCTPEHGTSIAIYNQFINQFLFKMTSKIMPTPEVFNRTAILNTYRQLLRATYIAFKGTNAPNIIHPSI
jgi:hypothetical protein